MLSRLFRGLRKDKSTEEAAHAEPAWNPVSRDHPAPPAPVSIIDSPPPAKVETPLFLSDEDRMLHEWVIGLPAGIRPHGLIDSYPRIAYRIAKYWPEPYKMQQYFNDLVFDNRGGRQGFPGNVAKEILTLHQYYEEKLVQSGMVNRPPTYL